MEKWMIDKQFSFCYGHRVWSQKLEHAYCETGDYSCKCRHYHGHEGLVHVFLESDTLERGMVTDFKHLGWLKNFLDDNLDHKFVIDINDPMFEQLVLTPYNHIVRGGHKFYDKFEFLEKACVGIGVPGTEYTVAHKVDSSSIFVVGKMGSPEVEVLEGFTIVDFVPTSEHFSKWLYELVAAKMSKLGVKVSRIDWFETPKSRSSYGTV